MNSDIVNIHDTDMEFDDATFTDLQFDTNYGSTDSPFDANRFFNLSAADNIDSPAFGSHDPSETTNDTKQTTKHGLPLPTGSLVSSRSAESSSQDSSSQASDRRKRKTTSESPPIENMAGLKVEHDGIKPEDMMDTNNFQDMQNFGASMGMDQDFGNTGMNNHFDFDSATSSPGGLGAGGYSDRTPLSHGGAPVRLYRSKCHGNMH